MDGTSNRRYKGNGVPTSRDRQSVTLSITIVRTKVRDEESSTTVTSVTLFHPSVAGRQGSDNGSSDPLSERHYSDRGA